ncbi:MAG: LysM peptidoglycan-binding domain-containing protein [Alicyclobacillus macrosporangiidus]|uniref:LysM peptidoglycan-binding domain-containing protein n=1 Tax=Alicyclobacillus macrosporangiidus TaxID=392015 RepID=UPI0026EEE657|nr:LysM domain-containing protein [Alicyclobacillus macrosporangiidus]MCL6597650.1 LysM peptidoglycan-binding domain-containing protein [Alicyclobacillus macrosporangiidus]
MKKYVVKKGDTMWSISKATGVRLNLLMAANPQITDPNRLQPGQVIYIPELEKSAMPPAAATPPGGPPAGKLGGPPSAAPGPGLMPGAAYTAPEPAGNQVARPGGEMPPYFGFVWPHVVQPGETWEHIAQRYGVSVQQLRRLNPTLGRALQEGDIVYVPGLGGAMPGQGPQPVGMEEPGFAPAQAPVPSAGPMQPGAPGVPYEMMPGMPYEMPSGMPYAIPSGMPYMPAPGPGMPYGPGPGMPETGPHTHYPYRAMAAWGRPVWAPGYRHEGVYPAPPHTVPYGVHPGYGYWPMSPWPTPLTWYSVWDESSSWESWSSSVPHARSGGEASGTVGAADGSTGVWRDVYPESNFDGPAESRA